MQLPALTTATTSYLCTVVNQYNSKYRAPSLASTLLRVVGSTEQGNGMVPGKIFPASASYLSCSIEPPIPGPPVPGTSRLMQIPLQRSCSLVTSVGDVGYTRDAPASGETNRRAPPFVGIWVQGGVKREGHNRPPPACPPSTPLRSPLFAPPSRLHPRNSDRVVGKDPGAARFPHTSLVRFR